MYRPLPVYEVTEITYRTLLSRTARFFFSYTSFLLAGIAFVSAFIALPNLWGRIDSDIQVREEKLIDFRTETRVLLNDIHATLSLSRKQTEQIETLSAALLDPKTGGLKQEFEATPPPPQAIAIIDFSQYRK
ncbi:MAG: hypothetical protein Q7S00_04540 [bacterium]|nr:hypothetical protein [bacterium]